MNYSTQKEKDVSKVNTDLKTKEEIANVEAPETVEEPVPTTDVDPIVKGIIVGCRALRIRQKPAFDATILSIIDAGKTVLIDKSTSVGDFYSVSLETGEKGFCLKRYVSVNE